METLMPVSPSGNSVFADPLEFSSLGSVQEPQSTALVALVGQSSLAKVWKSLAPFPSLGSFVHVGVAHPGDPLPRVLLHEVTANQPWRVEAMIDHASRSLDNRALSVVPRYTNISVGTIWAICGSPLSNAYLELVCNQRRIQINDVCGIPVPDLRRTDLVPLEQAIANHLVAISDSAISQENLKFSQWRIDAEVLKLYNLEASLERSILKHFERARRPGVPFEQFNYFPPDFEALDRLNDFLAITIDWPKNNQRRGELLNLKRLKQIAPDQIPEMNELQRLANALVYLSKPVHMENMDLIIAQLKAKGFWASSQNGQNSGFLG